MEPAMKSTTLRSLFLPLAAGALLADGAWAAPASTSPYSTDVVNEYVQDETSDGIANLNMVLCIMHGLNPSDMLTAKGVLNSSSGVTEVKYLALVDKNKCDTKSRASSSNSTSGASGSTATPAYMTAIVDVTRGSNATDPMVGKAWMTFNEQGNNFNISVKLTVSNDPVSSPPYGVVRMDYIGYLAGQVPGSASPMFNGYIDANGPTVNYLETGANSSNVALGLNAQSTTAGSGVIQAQMNNNGTPVTVSYKFAYNPIDFARNDGSGDLCFDRSKANAQRSVWRYGVYDATSGVRIDQAHPGFPISGTASGITGVANGTTMYGYASYWGINFGGVDQSAIAALPDGQVTAVANITDQRPGNTTVYNMYKNGGKLTQWTQSSTTLAHVDGIPFNHFGEGCHLVNGGSGLGSIPSPSGSPNSNCTATAQDYQNWVMQWDNTAGTFVLTGMQSCSPGSPCVLTTFAPVTVLQGFMHEPIEGYSDALGGDITIPLPAGDTSTSGSVAHAGGDTVYSYTQSTVLPGSASLNHLYCLSNCPTSASLSSFTANPSTASPFAAPTNTQWGAGAQEITYSFGSSGLLDSTSAAVELTSSPSNSPWQNGLMSGRLYTADLANGSGNPCPPAMGSNTPAAYCEPASPTVYYTYQTGPNQWNQTTWLTAGGNPVAFDPPQNIAFTVPSDSTFVALYGSAWAGKPIQLQFNGFGNLYGIPGSCVDPQTNAAVDCSKGGARYVPAFALLDGTALTVGSASWLVRALDAELRLKSIACPAGLSTSGITVTVPTAQPHNPALSSDTAYYIGTAPSLTGSPAVIDGVLQ
jgi:hypothetical protein